MPKGIKHLIGCHCVLPQFRRRPNPVFHKFVVFSVIDDDDAVISKIVKCNNCGVLHRVTDICKSEFIHNMEDVKSVITKYDIALMLPEKMTSILDSYDVDLPTWEQAQFIVDNNQWNSHIILTLDFIDGRTEGKLLRILGEKFYKIEPFFRNEFVDPDDANI